MDEEGRRPTIDEAPTGTTVRGGAPAPLGLRRHELSVLRSDVRGFTAFCEGNTPEAAIELLRDYYAMVAAEVAAAGAFIKEHAGDGTLILVGGSTPDADHAKRAIALGCGILARGEKFLAPRRVAGADLGLGIGVASGVVTVGTIQAGSRVESIAVGAAVNLAARLCARAGAGQILVAERTLRLLGVEDAGGGFERVEDARLKGFARPVPIFRAVCACC